MLIIPGTGLLTDAYGLLSWVEQLAKMVINSKSVPLQTTLCQHRSGPIYGTLSRCFVKAVLSLADFRSSRQFYCGVP